MNYASENLIATYDFYVERADVRAELKKTGFVGVSFPKKNVVRSVFLFEDLRGLYDHDGELAEELKGRYLSAVPDGNTARLLEMPVVIVHYKDGQQAGVIDRQTSTVPASCSW